MNPNSVLCLAHNGATKEKESLSIFLPKITTTVRATTAEQMQVLILNNITLINYKTKKWRAHYYQKRKKTDFPFASLRSRLWKSEEYYRKWSRYQLALDVWRTRRSGEKWHWLEESIVYFKESTFNNLVAISFGCL